MKTILLVIVLPVLLFALAQTLTAVYVGSGAEADGAGADIAWANNIVYFSYIVAGYISGYLSKSYGLLSGTLVGFLCAIVAVLFFSAGEGIHSANVMILIIGAVLGALGSVFSKFDLKSKKSVY